MLNVYLVFSLTVKMAGCNVMCGLGMDGITGPCTGGIPPPKVMHRHTFTLNK